MSLLEDKMADKQSPHRFLETVFGTTTESSDAPELSWDTLQTHLESTLAVFQAEQTDNDFVVVGGAYGDSGRLAPPQVGVDRSSMKGNVRLTGISELEAEGLSNFSSLRGNVCVSGGRWMYEVQLRTPGILQIGWATIDCPFTSEEGVGDAPDSFAYDGKRVKKWNVAAQDYGQAWARGDVIGVCIDLEQGEISYYRNGNPLGVAFQGIRHKEQSVAYFPSMSIFQREKCVINFGGTALKYPVPGYLPLQQPAKGTQAQAMCLLACGSRLIHMQVCDHCRQHISSLDVCLGLANVLELLGPLLCVPYVITEALVPYLTYLAPHGPALTAFLDAMFTYLEEHELHTSIGGVLAYISEAVGSDLKRPASNMLLPYSALCQSQSTLDADCSRLLAEIENDKEGTSSENQSEDTSAPSTKQSLVDTEEGNLSWLEFAITLLSHRPLLAFCMRGDLLNRHLEAFFATPQPSADDMAVLWPHPVHQSLPADIQGDQSEFDKTTNGVSAKMSQYYALQIQLCSLFLREVEPVSVEGKNHTASNREWFLVWIRHLRKRYAVLSRHDANGGIMDSTGPENLFYALLQCLTMPYWGPGANEKPDEDLTASLIEAFVHDRVLYSDMGRAGGSYEHLMREALELQKSNLDADSDGSLTEGNGLDVEEEIPDISTYEGDLSQPSRSTERASAKARLQLFDTAVILFKLCVSNRLRQCSSVRQKLELTSTHLESLETQRKRLVEQGRPPNAYLEEGRTIMLDELLSLARTDQWNTSFLLTKERQAVFATFLGCLAHLLSVLRTKEKELSYLPEFYLDTVMDIFASLQNFDLPNLLNDKDCVVAINRLVEFLVMCFDDKRITNPDTRDGLLQCLAFVLYTPAYAPLCRENPIIRESLMQLLLNTFGTQAWVTVSTIILKFWEGQCYGDQPTTELPTAAYFRDLFKTACVTHRELALSFVNQLFNHCNWAITELYVALQEITQLVRAGQHLDLAETQTLQHQSRKCAITFELTVCLLRVIEVLSREVPSIFLQSSDGDVNLNRLMQLICHVVHRTVGIGDGEGAAALVDTQLPNLKHVQHSQILAPVAGTMLSLDSSTTSDVRFVQSLAEYEGTSMEAFELMGEKLASGGIDQAALDSFYGFLGRLGVEMVEAKVRLAAREASSAGGRDGEADLCTICYTNDVDTSFNPCGHTSCRQCITRHLLNNKDCFFCKEKVVSVSKI